MPRTGVGSKKPVFCLVKRCDHRRALSLLVFLFLIVGCKGGGGNGAAIPVSNAATDSPWVFGFTSSSSGIPGSSTDTLVVDTNLSMSSQVQSTSMIVIRACIRPSFSSESLTGSVNGATVSLTLAFGGVTMLLTGTLSADSSSVSGTYTMSGACGNDAGTWRANKVLPINGAYAGTLLGTNSANVLNASIRGNLASSSDGAVTGTFSINSTCFKGNLSVTGTQTGLQFGGSGADNLGDSIEFAFASNDLGFQSMTGGIQVDTGACAGDFADVTLTLVGPNNGATGSGSTGSSLGWIWVSGSQSANQPGTYGTQGTAAAANIPGARDAAVTWTDAAGNFWLFGGAGYDSAGGSFFLNDLWKYSSGQWTWVGGLNAGNSAGNYGTVGIAAAGNVPAGRYLSTGWSDAAGNFWLFGGGCTLPYQGFCNDLWKYSAGEWAWMGGSNLPDQQGSYGTLGTAAPSNIPGGRQGAVSWTDAAGNFWLFGGVGYDSGGPAGLGQLNDLWKYSAEWTWMGGSNIANQRGTYGTLGIAALGNVPGARSVSVSWTDAAGNFWLFGGFGYDSVGTEGLLNDLWEYSAGKWAWMGGSNLANQQGNYGTQGVAAASNVPGARQAATGWTDKNGNLWLFGGSVSAGGMNDLWKYSAGQWTWVSGSQVAQSFGTYGTQGVAGPGNVPGGRISGLGWIDGNGNLWLFGGNGYAAATSGSLADLWMYEP